MSSRPSIKGFAMQALAEDVAKLLESGELSRGQAARWLRPEDFALVDSPIQIAGWYDIESYTRLTELLRDVEGGGDNAYLRERGRRTAQRLLESGLYLQLDYLHRAEVRNAKDPKARYEAFGRDLRKITTIAPSMLNFSKWSHRPDPERPGRYLLEAHEATPYSEVHCWTTEGFLNGMAPNRGDAELWRWSRPRPDLLVFHMTRDL